MTGAGLAPSTGVCLPQDTALSPPGTSRAHRSPRQPGPRAWPPLPSPEGWGCCWRGREPLRVWLWGRAGLDRLPSLPGWGLLICLDSFHCLHPLALRGCGASRQGQAYSSQASPGLAEQGSINICQAGPCLSPPATTSPVCTHTHTTSPVCTHTHGPPADSRTTHTQVTASACPTPATSLCTHACAHTHTHTHTAPSLSLPQPPAPSPARYSPAPLLPHFFLPRV